MGIQKDKRFNYNDYGAHTSGSCSTEVIEAMEKPPREQYDCNTVINSKTNSCGASYTSDDWHCNGCDFQGHENLK